MGPHQAEGQRQQARPVISSTGIFRICDLFKLCSMCKRSASLRSVCDAQLETLSRISDKFVNVLLTWHYPQFRFQDFDSKHLLLPGAGDQTGEGVLQFLPFLPVIRAFPRFMRGGYCVTLLPPWSDLPVAGDLLKLN